MNINWTMASHFKQRYAMFLKNVLYFVSMIKPMHRIVNAIIRHFSELFIAIWSFIFGCLVRFGLYTTVANVCYIVYNLCNGCIIYIFQLQAVQIPGYLLYTYLHYIKKLFQSSPEAARVLCNKNKQKLSPLSRWSAPDLRGW